MERESFENEVIAEILNREYVCVKVDREERPDVDSVYMSVCQAMNGQGGWPLTIIMTPDCRPFFSGTYFPPRARYGRQGLEELLTAAAGQWKVKKEKLLDQAGQIEKYLKSQERTERQAEPELGAVHQAFRQLADCFDSKNGGFGSAPKFPAPHNLIFLMEYGAREKRPEALAMAEKTLVQMYRGGIFDHIGGGFSRYSTDGQWLVPHFEKMLYDNSLLVMAYIKAYGRTGRKMYGCVAEKVLEYVRRELTDSQGGFYCGQDADSDGVEGKYYVFTQEEIRAVLGEKAGRDFCRQYGITRHGNFEGRSIPNLLENENYEEICEEPWGGDDHGGNVCHGVRNSFGGRKNEDCKKLYQYRLDRARLHKDDKILVSWNGWMICALEKLDTSKFFYSIDHETSLFLVGRKCGFDPWLMWLMDLFVNAPGEKFGYPPGKSLKEFTLEEMLEDVGLAVGNLLNQMLANVNQNEVDQYAKRVLKIHYYVRYMDDIVIMSDSKAQLHEWREKISEFMHEKLKLELNPKKCFIRPISHGVDFCQYRIYPDHIKLKKATALRMKRNLKRIQNLYAAGEISLERAQKTVSSYTGLLSHCDSYQLRRAIFGEYSATEWVDGWFYLQRDSDLIAARAEEKKNGRSE